MVFGDWGHGGAGAGDYPNRMGINTTEQVRPQVVQHRTCMFITWSLAPRKRNTICLLEVDVCLLSELELRLLVNLQNGSLHLLRTFIFSDIDFFLMWLYRTDEQQFKGCWEELGQK